MHKVLFSPLRFILVGYEQTWNIYAYKILINRPQFHGIKKNSSFTLNCFELLFVEKILTSICIVFSWVKYQLLYKHYSTCY